MNRKLGQQATVGIICSDDDNSKIHIELDKLMFVDSSKYSKFDAFMKNLSSYCLKF